MIDARALDGPRVEFWDLVTVDVLLSTVTTHYNEYAPATTGTEEGSFRGSFDGVPGTFQCSVMDGCTVRIRGEATSEAAKLISEEKWTFIADDHLAQVLTARKDGDYLTLGWWLEIPDAVEGEHEFAPFFAGRDPFTQANIQAVAGSAKYSGPAAGKYAYRHRGENEAYKGVFTAQADLTANFDSAPTTGPNPVAGDMIQGTISEFESGDGHNLGDWNVVLTAAAIATPIVRGVDSTASHNESRANGRRFDKGSWGGEFFGNGGEDDNNVWDTPTSVAGAFDAYWGDAQPMRVHVVTPVGEAEAQGPISPADLGFAGLSGVFGAHVVPE